jgi:hypothetical protein
VTGEFFGDLSVDALAGALMAFDARKYDPAAGRRNAARFEPEQFKSRLRQAVERAGVPTAAS